MEILQSYSGLSSSGLACLQELAMPAERELTQGPMCSFKQKKRQKVPDLRTRFSAERRIFNRMASFLKIFKTYS